MKTWVVFLMGVVSTLLFYSVLTYMPNGTVWAQTKLTDPPEELENREPPEFDENGNKTEPVQPEAKPELPPEPAGINPETLRMMEMIERKNRDLKQRENNMALREKNLQALETKIKGTLQKLSRFWREVRSRWALNAT